jgi:nitrate reductase gamma subunit
MDGFSYIVAGIMVYVAVIILILGIAYQIYQWRQAPKAKVRTGYFPKPETAPARWVRMTGDSFLFPQVVRFDGWMWVFTILFHFGLLGAFVGHLRLIQEFTFLSRIIGSKGMDQLSLWGGGVMGIALVIGLFYYLFRRWVSPYRELSVPEDYVLLILLLLVILMGNYMRFLGDIHTADYRAYLQSLLVFRPSFPQALAASSTKWALVLHVLFANLVFIILPFTKLIHMIAAFPSNLAKRA